MKFRKLYPSSNRIKITAKTNSNFKSLIKPLLKELVTNDVRKKLKGKRLEIIIPNNYGQAVYENSIEEEKRYYDKNGYSYGQGHFCISIDKNSREFKIIINKSTFATLQYFSTIYHEFTHVLDFVDYINLHGNPNTMDRATKHRNYYFEFYLWTEFNAKRVGIKRLLKELDKNDESIDLRGSTDRFIIDLAGVREEIPKLYALVHFLARISACNTDSAKLNPEIYPVNYLIANFGENVFEIHSTLEGIKNYSDFEKEKELLRNLLGWSN